MKLLSVFYGTCFLVCGVLAQKTSITVTTTSGRLRGADEDGVMSFKGVRFGQAPTGVLRWQPPIPFLSLATQDATKLGPSCVQQFGFATANLTQFLFNNPPPPEDEDCLFLNVWAPSPATPLSLKPVVVWIYGGGFAFGTGSLAAYDGTSFAKNQDVVAVTFNYRTNVFGFPSAPDLPLKANNLGFLDQELALRWVQGNIVQFGGNPKQVTIMGQSAGSVSVAAAITRHRDLTAPFRAGIMLSGAPNLIGGGLQPNFQPFEDFADAVNCTQQPGPTRLACLKKVPTSVIRSFTNGPSGGAFAPVFDNFTLFGDQLGRILAGNSARVPVVIGNTQNDSSLFVLGLTDLSVFLNATLPGLPISPDQVRALYPGLNDIEVIGAFSTDILFRCPVSEWAATLVLVGISNVFRYTYGAVFPDLQLFPRAGAWHASELKILFGTYNTSTATEAEVTLSKSLQTAFANFVKDPFSSPAPNWPRYLPSDTQKTLAELAFDGNVEFDNFVRPVTSDSEDGACKALLNIPLAR